MSYSKSAIAATLQQIDLGQSVAEADNLLEEARIETSAFADILHDRVDLVPGTKGSGKSALFRMFVDFLPNYLLEQRKVVVAHGVQAPGDPVFHAYTDQFEKLTDDEFVSFWSIYLVSLAHEHFIKSEKYTHFLREAGSEIQAFRKACERARIPEIEARKSLRDVLNWTFNVLRQWRPKLKVTPPGDVGEFEVDLFGQPVTRQAESAEDKELPKYAHEVKDALEAVLTKCNLSLWLMVDRLDEVFPRRSDVEQRALRGLLRAMRYFSSSRVRVKIFLRDDMLEHLVTSEDGFTALTHVAVRQADPLKWSEEQLLTLLVKRLFANDALTSLLNVNREQIAASAAYRHDCFYKVFPKTVFKGSNQSNTLRWILSRCEDARGVVTPRDVLDLVLRAIQHEQTLCMGDTDGSNDYILSSASLVYGYEELSKKKRVTYLQAEFPHLWEFIQRFVGGKTEYDEDALVEVLGSDWKNTVDKLVAVGFLSKWRKSDSDVYSIPFLYRPGLDLIRGRA
ncbi:MAG: hypothetical protein KIT10_15860 [Flavobacteriales bacterium]|nr:hypothetical protein [Flavobacteriales bacterium]